MILATDYDNTLCLNKVVDDITLNKIADFRKKGNKFIIITGRNFNSIKSEIDKFNLKFDYLIASNGAIIFDENLNELYSTIMPKDASDALFKFSEENDLSMFVFSNGHNVYFKNYGKDQATMNYMNKVYISKDEMIKGGHIVSFNFKGVDDQDTLRLSKYLSSTIDNIEVVNNRFICDVMAKGITKAHGLYQIMDHINDHEIHCIGDNFNDIAMIKEFNGYAVNNAVDDAKKVASKLYDNVGSLIDDLLSK